MTLVDGPKAPVRGTPSRRAPSVRRTSTITSTWPDGHLGRVEVTAAARDLRTTGESAPEELAADGYRATISAERVVHAIDHADGRLAALVGRGTGGGFRAAVAAAAPDVDAGHSLLHLLLDDLTGANLVTGYSFSRRADPAIMAVTVPDLAVAWDQCAGWATGASMYKGVVDEGQVPVCRVPPSPPLDLDDDPVGWHPLERLGPHDMRRARRLDAGPLPGGAATHWFDGHFRDIYADADGTETAVHEYTVWGTFDAGAGILVDVEAAAHVLPWEECPAAVASAKRVEGAPIDSLRASVRRDLVGTSTCTHLNDVLRSLADLGALADLLTGRS